MRKVALVMLVALAVGAALLPTAASAAPVQASTGDSVRIVDLNLLHGVFCGMTNGCQAPDRVALLARQLEEANCPEVVGLQEINANLAQLINDARKTLCDGKYKVVFKRPPRGVDTERVLTTLKVKSTKVIKLRGNFRTASRAVLSTPIGRLVLVVTHQDGDPDTPINTCATCPPPCRADASPFQCQTDAAAGLATDTGGPKAIHVLMGDFNVTPTSGRYQSLIAAGWVDSYLAAGNPECNPGTGVGCTSGRDDQNVNALKDPNAKESERIDFIFVKPPASCQPAFGAGTGLFAATPAQNGPGGLVWMSDHTGVFADLSCA